MVLVESQLADITYTNESKNETKARTIVPMSVPKDIVRAIDVSDLSDENRADMVKLVAEYKEYLADAMLANFKFEDWVEHTKNVAIEPKWRTFKLSNIHVSE